MTVAASTPSRAETLALFRSLLRIARDFSDYNIREYTKRRTIDGFRQNRDLKDPSAICSSFSDGKSQLEVAKRQAIVYSLYAPKVKSVMELEKI
ncbi:LYR motif-containing protein 4 [Macadamia integrifolia]|uniref:LYR motif-containing protein 4 n=1 Tax=Macadamia integrifolia TaxID=60698 RepID=UPI001C4E4A48|nr:LYR motif-containing protein 4 [Macadamia integrifolia]XP_042484780.1 LYR motif-containing protein 4 [Macadamia integrifolia]XP_042484781.1 LYR motif-containing protein 4 [Macadamia integrifolia]XP_042484782.1 LYR motif-containing protein 4 [Macadamia integrifolia]